jgi:hypothetical protein
MPARRLRVQLEGDHSEELYEMLVGHSGYRHAAALTAVATGLEEPRVGAIDEVAHYKGRFLPRGESFELHDAFLTRAIGRYRGMVEAIEQRSAIRWTGSEDTGIVYEGGVVVLRFERPVPDMALLLRGLFSSKAPFRLWGVPREIRDDFYEVEAVDLHIGEHLRMELSPHWVRLFLSEHSCGNTVLRLLTNLQHRFDAAVSQLPSPSIEATVA